jgi:hypothetical protein
MDARFLWPDVEDLIGSAHLHPEDLARLTVRGVNEWGEEEDWDEEDEDDGWDDPEEEDDWDEDDEDEDDWEDDDDWDA